MGCEVGRLRERNSYIWERGDRDWYVEPTRCTEQLCQHEIFDGPVHDPSCGGGNIVTALLRFGYQATGSDVVDRTGGAPWFTGLSDFRTCRRRRVNIVMNPPFFRGEGTEFFIRKAISIASGKVCAFTEARFLFGEGRATGLYRDHKPTRVHFVTPRPSCPPGEFLQAGGKATGGNPDFVWIVWDRTAPPADGLNWLS